MFATADGWVFVGATADEAASALDALGAVGASIEEAIQGHPTADCVIALRLVGAGIHPVASLAELMVPGGSADQRGLRLEDHSERHGAVVMAGPVVRLSRTAMRPGRYPGPFGSGREATMSDVAARKAAR